MNKNLLKILIPVLAVVVIVESIIFLNNTKTVVEVTGPVELPPVTVNNSITLEWGADVGDVKTGVTSEIPLYITSDKDVFIDALDLYINYDPNMIAIASATPGKSFVVPSFKSINKEKGMVVMNFLVSQPSGFNLKAGQKVEIVSFKTNFVKEGTVNLVLGDATLVVENASAKVLPFNSDKLVINVSP
jgi:hypothetical protein